MRQFFLSALFAISLTACASAQIPPPATQPTASAEVTALRAEIERLRAELAKAMKELEAARAEARAATNTTKKDAEVPQTAVVDGFELKNVTTRNFSGGVKFIGEVTNRSGKDYLTCIFMLTVYDANDELVDTVTFTVNNIPNGATTTFDALASQIPPEKAKKYKFHLEAGE